MSYSVCIASASPRVHSNSASIAEFIRQALVRNDVEADILNLERRWDMTGAAEEIGNADLLILVSPLYHDTLSWSATALLEEISRSSCRMKQFAAVVHSGYPEGAQRETALDICRCFADMHQMRWLGAVSPGLTSVIGGVELQKSASMFKNLRYCLEQAAACWAKGEEVPEEVTNNSQRPPVSPRLLKLMGNMSIRKNAKKKGLDILRKPYG